MFYVIIEESSIIRENKIHGGSDDSNGMLHDVRIYYFNWRQLIIMRLMV